jgi:outer membrane putative beta-barrel porin/alpha-amylase
MVKPGRRRRLLQEFHHWLVALVVGYSLLITGGAPAGAQQEGDSESTNDYLVKLSLLPEYSEGKYGTGHTTQILEVPFRAEWSVTDRLDLSLTIPYLWMRGRGDTTIVNGRPVRVVGRRPGQVTTEDGLGDILAEVGYTLLEEKGFVPDLTPFLEVKFPTADSSRGLGTGEFDEKIGFYVTKKVAQRWTTHVDLSYTFVGSPPHTALQNVFDWSVGLSYDATASLKLSGYIDGATAVSRTQQSPLDLRFRGEYQLTKHLQLTAESSVGLSHASPDFTFLAGIELRF